jgi:hypothetical protein
MLIGERKGRTMRVAARIDASLPIGSRRFRIRVSSPSVCSFSTAEIA